MKIPDHFNLDFDVHIFTEKLETIAKREGREPTPEETITAASESVMFKTRGLSPKIEDNDDRAYRSELVVFEALMQFQAKLNTGTYNTQERARIADSIAKDANKKIREYWEREE